MRFGIAAKLFFPREQSRGKAVLCFIRNLTPGFLGIMTRFMANMGCGEDMRAIFICREKMKKGADITLTLNHQIQEKAYSLIEGMEGSMIVLDIRTGRILALASSKTVEFNANQIADHMEEWNQTEGFFLPNGFKDAAEPGSTFKMVTAAALLEQGLEKDIIEDKGNTVLWRSCGEKQWKCGFWYHCIAGSFR